MRKKRNEDDFKVLATATRKMGLSFFETGKTEALWAKIMIDHDGFEGRPQKEGLKGVGHLRMALCPQNPDPWLLPALQAEGLLQEPE